jgi:hypothetical protein
MNNLRLTVVVAARQRCTAATTITTTSPGPIDNVLAKLVQHLCSVQVLMGFLLLHSTKISLLCHVLS